MNENPSLPCPPGHASDLPGHVRPSAQHFAAPAMVERLPDRVAARALVLVAVGGVLAQLLFYGQLLGINFPIWVAFVLGAARALRRADARIDAYDRWIPVAALTFASFCALRTDGMLLLFDVAATGTFTLAAIVAMGGQPLTRYSWTSIARYALRAGAVYLAGSAYLTNGLRAFPRSRAERQTTGWRVVLGLVYASPFIVVFIVLFAGADAVFSSVVDRLLPVGLVPAEITGRVVIALAAAWLLGGAILCGWLTRAHDVRADDGNAARVRIGTTEALVVLGAIDALFLIFVALQAAYLFGGLDTLAVTGMTYSDYARRGFGELIAAALLSGVVLVLLGHAFPARGRLYRALAALLAGLTGAVVVSALLRISVYQQAYGWTELRFYAVAAITWLAVCATIALGAAVLDRIALLPKLALIAGLVVAVACNVVGPQAFVTEQNVARELNPALVAPGGQSGLDVQYLSSLNADAIAVLARSANSLPDAVRTTVAGALSRWHSELAADAQRGWPSWNLARQRALDALAEAGY